MQQASKPGERANLTPQPTKGTEHVPAIRKWLPRLIIGAIAINLIPSLSALFDQRELGETIRNYANIGFIFLFIIITIRTISEKNNAKD